ncbi:unnamed protein product, partial [Effrenium voratum]
MLSDAGALCRAGCGGLFSGGRSEHRPLQRRGLRAESAEARGEPGEPTGAVVLGGGAAGLLAAMTAGRRGRKVTLLEKNPELGKKIRISGGGRCNFTNISDTLDVAYHSSRSSSNEAAFFEKAFARYPPEKFIGLVESHGIKYHEKKLGQLFCNKSAQQIVDMLQEECLAAKVDLRTGAEVCGVTREGPEYRVDYEQAGEAKELRAQAVLVASGGLSFARSCGSTDLAHRIAEAFQLK